MVVASSNNTAVENITNELPSATAIDDLWRKRADYFRQIATEVLHAADESRRETQSRAWGLIAARLGNAKNRNDFMNAFWQFPGDDRYRVVHVDCNVTIDQTLAELAPFRRAPTFAFVDQQAAEVHWGHAQK